MEIILDYARACERAVALFGVHNALMIWIPEAGFESALEENGSLSFTRRISEGGESSLYGFGIGQNPPRDPRWNEFSIPRRVCMPADSAFTIQGQWEAYGVTVDEVLAKLDEQVPDSDSRRHSLFVSHDDDDHAGITEFLRIHAPSSSTFPDSDEVIAWVTLRAESKLVAVAAIAEWESGGKVVSSVAVDSARRGEGLGRHLMSEVLRAAQVRKIDYLVLAVLSDNEAAKALYQRSGWELIDQFNFYKLPSA